MSKKSIAMSLVLSFTMALFAFANGPKQPKRAYNAPYQGEYLNHVAFPVGGMGAGMFCVEGTGAISHMSIRHNPELFREPRMYAAISIKGKPEAALVLEGQVPEWKKYGQPRTPMGVGETTWGLPRFETCTFTTRFPFATLDLSDKDLPIKASMNVWSPFIPADEDNSSLPVAGFEYTFTNTGKEVLETVFSYNSFNFMEATDKAPLRIRPFKNGFVMDQEAPADEPFRKGEFAIYTDNDQTVVDHCWFRGGWFDPVTMAWHNAQAAEPRPVGPVDDKAPGASLYVPLELRPGETKTIRLYMTWYVPQSAIRIGGEARNHDEYGATDKFNTVKDISNGAEPHFYEPWYAHRFKNIQELSEYWVSNYASLKERSQKFSEAFFSSTLPSEVIEAVAANMTILKSPTVMRQHDGRLWNWEGCGDHWGSCHGSCTHVWNYAQAICHLFPHMERSLRESEFFVSQALSGHQTFRTNMPIRPVEHGFHAACDGQLGGIMKVYRDWRISGDNAWMERMFPQVKASIDYCIRTWDPDRVGAILEPHHNTYDIEFWGANGMCTSFYGGALQSMVTICRELGKDAAPYEGLLAKNRKYMEEELFDGEYFIQKVQWKGLKADDPTKSQSFHTRYSPEALKVLEEEGPKYQYGTGCLSDGVLGYWMALMAGLEEPVDKTKVRSHLNAVHSYNLRKNLLNHSNPQRPGYAMGTDGGLLLCSWPKGGKPKLPFIYSDEVWTGIEYQVASHLICEGEVEKGLEIVRTCRDRYDGRVRNPFNEYECGGWYGRAMSSYGLIQALTGMRYDAVTKTLYLAPTYSKDFIAFLSTDKGFGTVKYSKGKVTLKIAEGNIDVKECIVAGKKSNIDIQKL